MPKPEKKGVEHNHYLDQISQNHLVIREKIQSFNQKLPTFKDSISFFNELYPMMLEIDEILATSQSFPVLSAADTLMDASSGRLLNDYNRLMNEQYIALFSIYHKAGDSLSAREQERADSIWQMVAETDQSSLRTFFRFSGLDSSAQAQFKPLVP